MDKKCFVSAGIPPLVHFEQSQMQNWQSISSAPEQSSDCFLNGSWDKPMHQYDPFESALSSMVSSPAASNSVVSNDIFAIRELIGKLGNICNSREISPHSQHLPRATAAYIGGGNSSANTSCYTTPLNSPPKLHTPIMDHFVKENVPNLGNSTPINPNLPALSADPGFAERAAKFSCFGSRSFNGRTSQLGLNNSELANRSNPLMGSGKLPRVSSSPSLKAAKSPMGAQVNQNSSQAQMEIRSTNTRFSNSNEGSSVSEQIPNGETSLRIPSDSNSLKRKAVSRGKSKENVSSTRSPKPTKVQVLEDEPNTKRSKSTEGNRIESGNLKTEEGNEDKGRKQAKDNPKPLEPPKDYIHVRARRGQATDSHSLAERVRREKISERMKLLQDLVPGCNKVTGKALMLDEIINYVKSLQGQVEFLSMKLASVNPRLDINMDSLLSKDVLQPNGSSLPPPIYPLDSSAAAFFGHQNQEIPQLHANLSKGSVTQCSVDPMDLTLCRNMGMQLPPVDEFGQGLAQLSAFCQDDLQSIVQMGFGQNPNHNTGIHSQSFPGSNQTSHMKIEL